MAPSLTTTYPWTRSPVLVSGPMRLISLPRLAVAVSHAGGIGFIGAGNDSANFQAHLSEAAALLAASPIPDAPTSTLPIGMGFIVWGADLSLALSALAAHPPAAVWLFAPEKNEDLAAWAEGVRHVSGGKTRVWVQIGTVAEALEVARLCAPDVLVVQGSDAGGHGLRQGAGLITLLPEVADALRDAGLDERVALVAAGGVIDGRGVVACLALGASGVAMGTRFLACKEASVATGHVDAVLAAKDGGVQTVRTRIYDTLRGTTGWPDRYGGRGVMNKSFRDHQNGMACEENKRLYEEALAKGDEGWGEDGRLATYAGTGVGLVREVLSAEQILEQVRAGCFGTNDLRKGFD